MKHKCFISFKTEDTYYKKKILEDIDPDMIDKSLNEAIDSDDQDYVMRKIREDYLSDSTVTIHLIGSYSAESLGQEEQKYIKRELQASLYNGYGNTKSGILGVVLPEVADSVYKGNYDCSICGNSHNYVNVRDTTVSEFSRNYYIPSEGKCCWTEDDRYCVLVEWKDFVKEPEKYIEQAFAKRSQPISNKTKVKP